MMLSAKLNEKEDYFSANPAGTRPALPKIVTHVKAAGSKMTLTGFLLGVATTRQNDVANSELGITPHTRLLSFGSLRSSSFTPFLGLDLRGTRSTGLTRSAIMNRGTSAGPRFTSKPPTAYRGDIGSRRG